MALTANDRVILIRAKTERAQKHFRELENELSSYRGKTMPVVIGEPQPFAQMGDDPLVHTVSRISFDALTMAGDVVHNLRGALDHLAYQLVLVGNPETMPYSRIEFPIAWDAGIYEKLKARKMEGMRPEAVKAIDELQPYKGGKGEALWKIHELDIIDKHRTVFSPGKDFLLEGPWVGPTPYLLRVRDPHF